MPVITGNTFTYLGVNYVDPDCHGGILIVQPEIILPPAPVLGAILLPPGFLGYNGFENASQNPGPMAAIPGLVPVTFPTFTLYSALSNVPGNVNILNPTPTVMYQWTITLVAGMAPSVLPNLAGGYTINLGNLFCWAWTGTYPPSSGNFSNWSVFPIATAGLQ